MTVSLIVKRLLLLGLSLLLPLVLIEGVLRLLQPAPIPKLAPQLKYVRVPRDPGAGRLAGYWYLEPRQNSFNLSTPVATNSLGLRNAEVGPKTTGRRRIVALGDSHTFGYAVPEPETWPRQLEDVLRADRSSQDAEVINAGFEALAIEQEVQLLKDRLLPLEPDVVILAYYWNDMPMLVEPFSAWPAGEAVVPPSMRPAAPPAPAAAASQSGNAPSTGIVEWLRGAAKSSYLLYFVLQRVPFLQMAAFPALETKWKEAALKGQTPPAIEASWRFVRGQLLEFKDLSLQAGFEPWVLVIPLFEQMTTDGYGTAGYQAQVVRICQELGIGVVEPLEAIKRLKPTYPEFFVPFDGHPNGRIYEVVASETARALKRVRD